MKYIIFSRSIVFVFYINLIEPDRVNKKLVLYTTAASLVESFDTVEQLEQRLIDVAELLQVKETDIEKLNEQHETDTE